MVHASRANIKLWTIYEFAQNLAHLSTCKRAVVGCVVVPMDLSTVESVGYNGVPRGTPNTACSGVQGSCGCIHAEANAIAKLKSPRTDLILISTVSPCAQCAGLIANTRQIIQVHSLGRYRDQASLSILSRAGVDHRDVSDNWEFFYDTLRQWRDVDREGV